MRILDDTTLGAPTVASTVSQEDEQGPADSSDASGLLNFFIWFVAVVGLFVWLLRIVGGNQPSAKPMEIPSVPTNGVNPQSLPMGQPKEKKSPSLLRTTRGGYRFAFRPAPISDADECKSSSKKSKSARTRGKYSRSSVTDTDTCPETELGMEEPIPFRKQRGHRRSRGTPLERDSDASSQCEHSPSSRRYYQRFKAAGQRLFSQQARRDSESAVFDTFDASQAAAHLEQKKQQRLARGEYEHTELKVLPADKLIQVVLGEHGTEALSRMGLKEGSPYEAIRKRYLLLAKRLHPDRLEHPNAQAAFAALEKSFHSLEVDALSAGAFSESELGVTTGR
eukprot:5911629-Prymnesium_polylepis.1